MIDLRQLIAYVLIAFMVAALVALVFWMRYRSPRAVEKRRRDRNRR